jgi:O-antigen/teichoic acid export membrane protein
MKATSLFGGVQVFNIVISLIRGKAVAVLIGSEGMGLNGFFLSGINLIKELTSLGLESSAVRDMSLAFGENDPRALANTYTVFRRWIWFTAVLGAVATILFAPLLSKFAFGNDEYTSAFMWLSFVFVFGALTGGIYTILRATRKVKYLAQANIYGAVSGLLVTLPILYVWGVDGVMPSIIVASLATYLISLYFRKNVKLEVINVTLRETIQLGKPMVVMGINMSLGSLMGVGTTFALNAFITNQGSLSDLGLYSAGMSIMGGYVGLVFTAIGTDYFPRLSAEINNEKKWKPIVNQQSELVLIILNIVLVILVASAPILIRILLSVEFLQTQNFIILSSIGVLLKGYVWVTGFVVLSKGDNKLFFLTELFANSFLLLLNIFLYKEYGIDGLGISMIIGYSCFSIIMYFIMLKKYDLNLSTSTYFLLLVGIISLIFMILIHFYMKENIQIISLFVLTLSVISFQLYQLDKRIQIIDILFKYFNKTP